MATLVLYVKDGEVFAREFRDLPFKETLRSVEPDQKEDNETFVMRLKKGRATSYFVVRSPEDIPLMRNEARDAQTEWMAAVIENPDKLFI